MSFERIAGQPGAVAALKKRLESGTLPHALLFTGPRGVGKRTAALELARCLLCPKRGCGACDHCRKAAAGVHPDLAVIVPNDKSNIKLEEITGILDRVALKPFEAGAQAIVMDDAHRMTDESQNAFLKALEEPPRGVFFILVTSDPHALLPTVVSRCQRVAFEPLGEDALCEILSRGEGADPGHVREIARLARGSLERAAELQDTDAGETLERAFEVLATLRSGDPDLPPDRGRTGKEEALAEIDALTDLFRDMLVLRTAGRDPKRLLNAAHAAELERAAARFSADEITDLLESLGAAREAVENSLNLRLVYADLWKRMGVGR